MNAVTHREYAMEGAYIQVNMFDDRMEVISPGALPSVVTVENIQYTRFSRNGRIARALSDFGWVRELNEGVRRIYAEMKKAMLAEPVYTEPDNRFVKVTLMNNVGVRVLRSSLSTSRIVSSEVWDTLDPLEKEILVFLVGHSGASTKDLVEHTHRSAPTVKKRLDHLLHAGIVICSASSNYDPNKSYSIAQ